MTHLVPLDGTRKEQDVNDVDRIAEGLGLGPAAGPFTPELLIEFVKETWVLHQQEVAHYRRALKKIVSKKSLAAPSLWAIAEKALGEDMPDLAGNKP
jgi:hypothetical protein